MGDIADSFLDDMLFSDDENNDPQCPEYYLDMDDSELIQETARARDKKIMGIRKYKKLSLKQRWCLAKWLSDHFKYES